MCTPHADAQQASSCVYATPSGRCHGCGGWSLRAAALPWHGSLNCPPGIPGVQSFERQLEETSPNTVAESQRKPADAEKAVTESTASSLLNEELELTPEEIADITALAGLVSRPPRAVKRIINTYHLLKVIEGDPTELERVRVLLAIAVGRPSLGERLLTVIMLDQVPGAEPRRDS